ncbi:Rod binding protein [Palleronia salina]|uniref:Rod binding protein n=2 Tax=Palleronia TaxID=315422 RepID=A0A1M6EDC9_9RHOB|nr:MULTISPECIES: rod-binding protein [Palleronia]SEO00699.1 Rod binding protein [Palleronia pelagia]SHI83328.1 Rod binding protein [Palleronia salina]
MTPIPVSPPSSPPAVESARRAELRETAMALEATFLSLMLKDAGLAPQAGPFGGGAGEDQFASLMRDERARQLVEAGGIGLTEQIFDALMKREARNV